MKFTAEHLEIIREALEQQLNLCVHEFERDMDRRDMLAMQRAIRNAREVKRFSKVLVQVEEQLEREDWSA